ncbi:MAG: hypothetical protein MJZ18_01630 [Bacteroidales bacterium]|nr:hypothetical protein [Bacteroidales bacterium]
MKTLFLCCLLVICCIQANAQTIKLRPNISKEPVSYVVDYMQLDSMLMSSIGFKESEISKIKVKKTSVIVTTKLLVVLDGQLLTTSKEKKAKLSSITSDQIASIEKIDKDIVLDRYGRKGSSGALLVTTK